MIKQLIGFIGSMWAEFVNEFTFVFIEDNRYQHIVKGFGNTLKITAGALLVGIIIGIIVAAVRSSYDKNREIYTDREETAESVPGKKTG